MAEAAVLLASGRGIAGERLQQAVEAQLTRRGVAGADRDDVRADVAYALLLSPRDDRLALDAACALVGGIARNKAIDQHRRRRREAPASAAVLVDGRARERSRRRVGRGAPPRRLAGAATAGRRASELRAARADGDRDRCGLRGLGARTLEPLPGARPRPPPPDRRRSQPDRRRSRIARGAASQAGIRARHPRTGLRRGRRRHRERRARAACDRAVRRPRTPGRRSRGCHPARGIRRGARVDTTAPAPDTPARAHPGGSTRGAPSPRAAPGHPSDRDTGAIAHSASGPRALPRSTTLPVATSRMKELHMSFRPRSMLAALPVLLALVIAPAANAHCGLIDASVVSGEGLVRAVRCSADAAVQHRRRRGVAARLRERGERDLLRRDERRAVRLGRDTGLEHLLAGREPDPRGALLRRGDTGHEGDRELRPECPDGRLEQPCERPLAPRLRTAAGRRSRRPVGRRPLRADPRSRDGRLVRRRCGHARHHGPSRRAARPDGHGRGSSREPLRGRNALGQDRQRCAARLARRAGTGDPGLGLAGACGERRRQRERSRPGAVRAAACDRGRLAAAGCRRRCSVPRRVGGPGR